MIQYEPADWRLLFQTRIWVDRYGETHDLETMNVHHRACLIPFLRARVDTLWLKAMLLGEGMHAISALAESDPEYWLERTPLMLRLVELDQRSLIEKVVTRVRSKAWVIRQMIRR